MSKQEALGILKKPASQLNLASDYYKAVFHLAKYPGEEAENALLKIVESDSNQECIRIARRKAVEVLGRFSCKRAIPSIRKCLRSSDNYLVENAVWALAELECKDLSLIKEVSSLLDTFADNKRVLIQCLSKMDAISELSKIRHILDDPSENSFVRGACIAAIANLSGSKEYILDLKKFLFLDNQNARQCAVQDVIDAQEYSLVESVLKSPVAPSFRLKALNSLWTIDFVQANFLKCISTVDSVISDSPSHLNLLNPYKSEPSDGLLLQELFSTDFNRSYLAIEILKSRKASTLFPLLNGILDRASRDYGAIYFFLLLFNLKDDWPRTSYQSIIEFALNALDSRWPDFIKFKPTAIITLMKFQPDIFLQRLPDYLSQSKTPFWASRYAAVMSLDHFIDGKTLDPEIFELLSNEIDTHLFVNARASFVIDKINKTR